MKSVIYNGLANTFGTMQNRIVKDSKGNLYLAMFSYSKLGDGDNAQYDLLVYKSTDNGQTWRELPQNSVRGLKNYKPSIMIDKNDKITIVWLGTDNKNYYYVNGNITRLMTVNYMVSTDGETFSEPQYVPNTYGDASIDIREPNAIIDDEGTIHLTYVEYKYEARTTITVKYTYLKDGIWSTPETIFSGAEILSHGVTHMVVDSKGDLYVAYSDLGDEGSGLSFSHSNKIYMKRRFSLTKTWSSTYVVNQEISGTEEAHFQCKLTVAPNDDIYITWFGTHPTIDNRFFGYFRIFRDGEFTPIEISHYNNVAKGIEGGLGDESPIRNMTLIVDNQDTYMLYNATVFTTQQIMIRRREPSGEWTPQRRLAYGSYPNVIRIGDEIGYAYMDYEDNCISFGRFDMTKAVSPVISEVTSSLNTENTIVRWESINQRAYNIQVIEYFGNKEVYNTGMVSSTNKFHVIPANTLDEGTYFIRLLIMDNNYRQSSIAKSNLFRISTSSEVPVADLMTPYSVGSKQGTVSKVLFSWKYIGVRPQKSYRLRILDRTSPSQDIVLFDSGTVNSSDTSVLAVNKDGAPLNHSYGKFYVAQLTVTDTLGITGTTELEYIDAPELIDSGKDRGTKWIETTAPDLIKLGVVEEGKPVKVSWRFRTRNRIEQDIDGVNQIIFLGKQKAFRVRIVAKDANGNKIREVFDSGYVYSSSNECIIPYFDLKSTLGYELSVKTINDEGYHTLYGATHLDPYNIGDTPPIVKKVTSFDALDNNDITWEFKPARAKDTQIAYRIVVIDSNEEEVYDTGKIFSTESKHTIPAYTLTNGKYYQLMVKTWGSKNSESAFSKAIELRPQFNENTLNVSILRPLNNSIISSNNVKVTWNITGALTQKSFTVKLIDVLSGLPIYQETIESASREFVIPYTLLNKTDYKVAVSVTGTDGSTLNSMEVRFSTLFTESLAPNNVTIDSIIDTKVLNYVKWDIPANNFIQTAAQVLVIDQSNNSVVFDSNKVETEERQYAIRPNSLLEGKSYLVKVRVWDEYNIPSLYSATTQFATKEVERPNVNISFPAKDNDIINTDRLMVNWEYFNIVDQSAYQIKLINNSGEVIYDSGKVANTEARAHYISEVVLESFSNYVVSLVTWNNADIQSNEATRAFKVMLAPKKPTNIKVGSFDANNDHRIEWDFNGSTEYSSQSAYHVRVYRTNNSLVYDSGKVLSPYSTHIIPANSLENGCNYYLDITVFDENNIKSDVSERVYFTTKLPSPPPNVIITSFEGDLKALNSVTVQWIFQNDLRQKAYRVVLLENNREVFNSGQVESTHTRKLKIPVALKIGANYTVKVTAWNTENTPSKEVVQTIEMKVEADKAPSNLRSTPLDSKYNTVLSWRHNPYIYDDVQEAYQIVLYNEAGEVLLDTGKVYSNEQKFVVPSNIISSSTKISWKVKTWSTRSESAFSELASFSLRINTPQVEILQPISIVQEESVTLKWLYTSSKPQKSFRVRLLDATETEVYDSGIIVSSDKEFTIPYKLEDNSKYTVNLVVANTDDVTSESKVINIKTKFDIIAKPIDVTNYLVDLGTNNQTKIVQDSAGVIYEAHQRGGYVEVFKSLDNGISWINTEVPVYSGVERMKPTLVVGANNIVYLFFLEKYNESTVVAYMEYNGTMWINRGSVKAQDSTNQLDVAVSADSNGTLMVVWIEGDKENEEIKVLRSATISNRVINIIPDNIIKGEGQSSPTVVSSGVNKFLVFWSGKDDSYSTPQIKMAEFDGGWKPWRNIAPSTAGSLGQTNVSVAKNGNVISVAWLGSSNLAPDTSLVHFTKSNDLGNSWIPVKTLGSELGYNQSYPNVSLTPDNETFVFWAGRDSDNPIYEQVKFVIISSNDSVGSVRYLDRKESSINNSPAAMRLMTNNILGILWIDHSTGSLKYNRFMAGGAPLKPTNLTSGYVDYNNTVLEWKFNSLNYKDSTEAFDIEIYRNGVLETAETISTGQNQYVAYLMYRDVEYTWRVRVKGSNSKEYSPFSDLVTIIPVSVPTYSITKPSTKVTSSTITVEWNYTGSEPQSHYEVTLKDSSNKVLWTSKRVASTANSIEIPYILSNLTSYKVELTLWDGRLQGKTVTKSFSTDFPMKPAPKITTSIDECGKGIKIEIDNLTSDKNLVNHIYKSTDGVNFIKIKEVGVNQSYTDFLVSHNVTYYYKVKVTSIGLAYKDSEVFSRVVMLEKPMLNLVKDGYNYLKMDKAVRRDINEGIEVSVLEFAGRTKPISEFGEQNSSKVRISFYAVSGLEIDKVYELYRAKSLVMYRDLRGRKMFGTMSDLNVVDKEAGTYEVSFNFTENDYSEEV